MLGKSWKTAVLMETSTVTGSFPGSEGSPQKANNTALQLATLQVSALLCHLLQEALACFAVTLPKVQTQG